MKHPDDMFYSTVYGMVDKNNTTVVPFEYDAITPVKNGAAYAIKDGKVFVLKFAEPSPVDPNDISNIFTDVPDNAWYAGYLQKAYDNKIVGGTSADKYSPSAQLTHAQIMVMVAQLHSKQKGDNYDFAAHQKPVQPGIRPTRITAWRKASYPLRRLYRSRPLQGPGEQARQPRDRWPSTSPTP